MATQGLNIDPPSRKTKRRDMPEPETRAEETREVASRSKRINVKFDQLAEADKVQFNKRVTRSTADGYEILSNKTRKKIPALLAEGLELLETKYGKV